MAKAMSRVGSRRNGRIGSRKSACRIPKGVIHVQASFNNTIMAVTDKSINLLGLFFRLLYFYGIKIKVHIGFQYVTIIDLKEINNFIK